MLLWCGLGHMWLLLWLMAYLCQMCHHNRHNGQQYVITGLAFFASHWLDSVWKTSHEDKPSNRTITMH